MDWVSLGLDYRTYESQEWRCVCPPISRVSRKDKHSLTSTLNLQLYPVASFGIHRQIEYRDVYGRLDYESCQKWSGHRTE